MVALSLFGTLARAEYMEVAASQIVTVTAGKDANSNILVQWELPKSLDELIVDAAVMVMTVQADGDEPLQLDAHPVLKAWEATALASWDDWAKGDQVYSEDVASPAIVTRENEGKVSIDLYLQVLDQIAGKAANFGFVLVPESGTATTVKPIEANAHGNLADARLIIAYRTQR
jgi:hypothetical protein